MADTANDARSASSKTFFDADFDLFVDELLQKHHVAGLSIAAIADGKVYTKGYGFARLPDVRAEANTLWCVGSTTKAMLAAGIGLAMDDASPGEPAAVNEERKILQQGRWSTPIKWILKDDFALEDTYATDNITIEDALSHRTGFPGADQLYGKWMGERPKAIVKALRYLGPLNKPFRTFWQYNNLMYSAVGDVLEIVAQTTWGAALHRLLWGRLGMNSTFSHIDEIPKDDMARMARGYYWTGKSQTEATAHASSPGYVPEPYLGFAGIGPAGSVVSSVEDLAKWAAALLAAASSTTATAESALETDAHKDSTEKDSVVISKQLFTELTSPRITMPVSPLIIPNSHLGPFAYSLGWIHFPYAAGIRHPIIGHGGGLTGFGTLLYLLPNDNFGVVLMANALSSGHRVGEKICSELLAKRLELNDEAKLLFQQTMSMLPPLQPESDTATEDHGSTNGPPNGDVSHSDLVDGPWAEFVREISGQYSNPAYGTVEVTSFEHKQDAGSIIYASELPKQVIQIRDTKRAQARSLSLSFTGHRSWNSKMILRSIADVTLDLPATATFFDLELFTLHGLAAGSPTELAGQVRQISDESPASSDWESQSWTAHGAAFVRAPSVDGKQWGWKMGLRLGTAFLGTNGNDSDGWEKEMIWFHQIHEAQ